MLFPSEPSLQPHTVITQQPKIVWEVINNLVSYTVVPWFGLVLWREHLSQFQAHNSILLTMVTMLYVKSEFLHATAERFTLSQTVPPSTNHIATFFLFHTQSCLQAMSA